MQDGRCKIVLSTPNTLSNLVEELSKQVANFSVLPVFEELVIVDKNVH